MYCNALMYKWLKCKIYQILLCFLSDMYIGIQYIVCGNFVCLESVHNFPNYCFGLCMFLVHIFLNSHRLGYYPRPLSVCKLWYIRATETHIFKTTYNMGMDFQKGTFQKGACICYEYGFSKRYISKRCICYGFSNGCIH